MAFQFNIMFVDVVSKMLMTKTYLDFLEGAVEHCDEHVQQDDHHDDVVHPVQNIAYIFNELMVDVNDH